MVPWTAVAGNGPIKVTLARKKKKKGFKCFTGSKRPRSVLRSGSPALKASSHRTPATITWVRRDLLSHPCLLDFRWALLFLLTLHFIYSPNLRSPFESKWPDHAGSFRAAIPKPRWPPRIKHARVISLSQGTPSHPLLRNDATCRNSTVWGEGRRAFFLGCSVLTAGTLSSLSIPSGPPTGTCSPRASQLREPLSPYIKTASLPPLSPRLSPAGAGPSFRAPSTRPAPSTTTRSLRPCGGNEWIPPRRQHSGKAQRARGIAGWPRLQGTLEK